MRFLTTSIFIWFITFAAFGQNTSVPTLHTSSDILTMYLDGQKDEFNGINKIGNQFNYSFVVKNDSAVFRLVSELDSISVTLRPRKNAVFKIVRTAKQDTVTCIFTMQKLVKPASFSDQYKSENNGKIIVEIPEVYELVNIVFALTEYGKTGAINKDTDYYKKVVEHFSPYSRDSVVLALDSLLKVSSSFFYPHLKMDSYAYVFSGNEIINGGIYDRVSWGEKNELEFYIPLLQAFALKSGFRAFYKGQQAYYSVLKNDYEKNINVAGMKIWLEKQFPGTRYSATKVIFSPLVGWNQSANFFNDNGFTESQAHVNFPFANEDDKRLPAHIFTGKRMIIAFTEINHGYLNPEAEKYGKLINDTFKNLSEWIFPGKPSSTYYNALVCFEEYMNYALVSLYYSDIFDKKTAGTLNADIERNMVDFRGFQRFREFNQELLRLYKSRKPAQTVADLYPAIIDWASKQGQ